MGAPMLRMAIPVCLSLFFASQLVAESVDRAFSYTLVPINVFPWIDGEMSGAVTDHQGQEAKILDNELRKARSSISAAVYGVEKQEWFFNTIEALLHRGIQVHVVADQTDGTVSDPEVEDFTYPDTMKIEPLVGKRNFVTDNSADGQGARPTIMHDKFIVIDHKVVWTGSTNITHTCLGDSYNANLSIIIRSPEVARLYEQEFAQMFSEKLFSHAKHAIDRSELVFSDGTKLAVFFSPKDDAIHKAIIPFIKSATKTLDIGMFYLTDQEVADELVVAKRRGVKIRLVYDAVAASNPSSKHEALRKKGIEVRVENWGGKMHMKTAVADGRNVIIGSMNWSGNGNANNDENTLVIRNNAKLAKEVDAYLVRLWNSLDPERTGLDHDPRAESHESINSCSDGIDNNHNGTIDERDAGCRS